MRSDPEKNQEMIDQRAIPQRVEDDLGKLGFNKMDGMDVEIRKKIDKAFSEKKERLAREAKQEKKKEFDF